MALYSGGLYGGGPYAARPGAVTLPPEEEESMLRSLSRNTGNTIELLAKTLDTPGAILRGALAGDPTSGFSWDSDRRVTGEELLQSYGLVDEETNPYAKAGFGLAAEVALDPLAIASFPLQSLTKAGKAAKAANILDLAPIAAQTKLGAAAANTITGRRTAAALDSLMPRGLAQTADNYAVRPLVGPRLARTEATLDDVVQAAPDPTEALERVTQYLTKKGLSYDDIKGDKLGGAFGLGIGDYSMTFTPPGSKTVLDALDATGQAIAWSRPARIASALFDQRVGGMVEQGDQIAAIRQFKQLDQARGEGRAAALRHAETVSRIPVSSRAAQMLGSDTLLSRQGNDFLTRVFENRPTQMDRALMRELPGVDEAIASWDRIRRANVDQAKALGLDVAELQDPRFGVAYSPRSGSELDFGEYGTGFGRSQFNVRTAEEMSRNPNLFTPGGTTDLREVSLLPSVREHVRLGTQSPYSIEQLGTEVAGFINRKHGVQAIDQAQGEAIARVLQRMNKDLPSDMPIFAGHPLNEQTRVIISQEVARANARYVYESLVESAVDMSANAIPGSGFKRLDSAAADIAGKVGLKTASAGLDPAVQKQITDRIAAKFGLSPDQVNLANLAIPEQVYNRLSRIQDFYSSPRAQQEVSGMFDQLTNVWKGFLLAFPARHVRDMYSNAYSVWLETGDPVGVAKGFSIAKRVLGGRIDDVLPEIGKLPQYQGIADPTALKTKFLEDVARAGVLQSTQQADLLTARSSGELSQVFAGLNPMSRLGAFKELIPDGSRNPLQMISDFGQMAGVTNRYETRNPLLNWSQKLSDVNDGIARLGGFVALLRQGVAPEAAAQRIQRALVDYGSLTPFERGVMKKIFPWWSYTSRIGSYVVQSMLEKPGGLYGQTLRASEALQRSNDETYVPQRLRQSFAVRVPDELLSYLGIQQKPGNTTFASDFDLPGIDALGLLNPKSLQGTIGNLLGQTNPFIKGTAELAFDQDLFSKRRLEDADPAVNRVYRWLTGGELSPTAKVIGSNLPATQRLFGVIAGLTDDRYGQDRNIAKTLLNSTAGVKVSDYPPEMVIADAVDQLESGLGPYRKYFTRSYFDKEKLATAPPEIQKQAALAEILNKRRTQQLKNRNKTPPISVPFLPGT